MRIYTGIYPGRHTREIYHWGEPVYKRKVGKVAPFDTVQPRPRKRKRSGENGRKGRGVIFPTVDIILSAPGRKKYIDSRYT